MNKQILASQSSLRMAETNNRAAGLEGQLYLKASSARKRRAKAKGK
jgi:hypothetical protein